MSFVGNIVVSPADGKRWHLREELRYQGNKDLFVVPVGFVTDFASVPRVFTWLLPRYGRWTPAAILHDYLWALARQGKFRKIDADGLFNRALRELGVPFLRRWIMWTAVRWAAGPTTWFQKGPVPFLKMIAISIPTLAVVVVPAVAILAGLIVGFLAELIAYVPLRLFHRTERKQVNTPDPREMLLS